MKTQHWFRSRRVRGIRVAVVGAGLLALALSGCAGQGSGGGEDGGSADGKVSLTFWNGFTGPDGPALQQVIDDFNASQDDVEVTAEIMPWDTLYQKVLTAVAGNDGPDIIAMSAGRMPQFAQQGMFEGVDDYYEDSANDSAALAPAAIEASVFDGVNYGVPVNFTPMMMYYNKDLFEAAGLDPEAPPTTWDEFAAMVPQLTVDDNGDGKPEQYATALGDHETVPVFMSLPWGTGGGVVSDDGKTSMLGEPASIEALDFWVDLVKNQKASPLGLSGADADKLFTTGKAATEIVGPWMTTGFDEAGLNYGIAAPPAGPDSDAILADVVSMGITSGADDATKQAAYQFFKYWNSKEGQITWSSGSGFPPNRADVADQVTSSPYPAVFGAADVVDRSKILLAGVAAGGTIGETIFWPTLQKALNGQGTVEELFSAASEKVQAELDK
ncbi:ABC transporter substrate-binding protein [Microbacterium sp. 10M-3C3]|jgi:multiple sugar transport system substrate-binding protein|uniref:ABC transporter substrate-binding protein n=1 Tax=Microbacterium sp. 10M-3C3 TaxID=2483401 RepID=UPI000F62E96F|nr:ABC transporter substrate-binding protein [Microbacterium sp. 10M-3C3]